MLLIKNGYIKTMAGDDIENGYLLIGDDGRIAEVGKGEPKTLELPDVDIDTLTDLIWTNLNQDNKVSLFVRYIDIASGESETRIVNKNV